MCSLTDAGVNFQAKRVCINKSEEDGERERETYNDTHLLYGMNGFGYTASHNNISHIYMVRIWRVNRHEHNVPMNIQLFKY